ncbi:MAG TPA: MFS transporter [Pyrinomonadaceae bacterium]|nr:MFS transporter [Pyrinomonadaceae bacterium]
MNTGIRWRLSVMMFLQYMVWGAWSPVFSAYLERIGFSGVQSGVIYSLLPLACMIAPFAGGQLADRYVATEKLLGILHLIGGVVLCVAATSQSYGGLLTLMLVWSLVYAPTLALTNSITFHHLPDAEKKFGLVRVFGTLGWIAAGLGLSALRQVWPEAQGLPGLGGSDSLWLGGFIALALGLFCFALPKTPPARTSSSPWAFLAGFKLMKEPSFALFVIIAFVVATELMFYYVLTAPFLQSINISSANIPAVMTIAQIAEIGTMIALPWMLSRWGIRGVMTLGIMAWPIRYAIFAYGAPTWLVVAALTLHGLCYVCFFVVSFIYVNSVASPDIRASAQAFITFVTLGAGMYVGSLFAGWIRDFYTVNGVVNYTNVFLVPCVLTILCAVVFFFGFREKKSIGEPSYQAQPIPE